MPVDTSTPVPDELDARVEQMLQHMDRVHAEVVNRLDPPSDERSPDHAAPSRLDAEVERALQDAAAAAKAVSEPVELPTATVDSNGAGVPTATIKELDEQLARAVSKAIDDDFADGTEMVEGQSLDVPLPSSSPLGELPAVQPPETVVIAPAPVAEPAHAAPAVMPAPVAKPAPVHAPAPTPAPAAKPAPAPVKAVTPAVIVPVKPAGPTVADRFWTVATPVMEPIAVRLGKLPVGFQHTVGWIGIVTLFMAGATWGYVLFFQETRPASHILEQESKEHGVNETGVEPDKKPASDHKTEVQSGHESKKPSAPAPHDEKKAPEAEHKPDAHAPGH